MTKVYLETSFLSACVGERDDLRSEYTRAQSRRWWTQQRASYELFVSAEVTRELSSPTFSRRSEALALAKEAKLLPFRPDVRALAKVLVTEKVMPQPIGTGDALHVAAAVVHEMDFVLTWNQRHLANPNKVRHLVAVCAGAGYLMVPQLVTPDDLWLPSDEERA